MKRNLYITLIGAVVLLFVACDKDLEIEPESSITSSSFWQTEGDANGALTGAYTQFRATFDMKMIVWGDIGTQIWDYGEAGGFGEWERVWLHDITPSTPRTNWARIYVLINDCNAIIKNVPDIDFANEEEKTSILGQAYFLRAFSYFWLAKVWGDAPIVLEPVESPNEDLNFTRDPVAAVLEQAKSDIMMAETRVLPGGPDATPYLINKASANMLIADIHLWTAKLYDGGAADLAIANTAIDKVLSAGYSMDESYEAVIRNEASPEIIFSIFYSNDEPSHTLSEGSDETGRFPLGTNVGNATLHNQVPDSLIGIVPFKNSPSVLRFSQEYADGLADPSVDARTPILWQEIQLDEVASLKWINKYLGEIVDGERLMIDNMFVYRYADALLFKAEIENALGNPSVAIDFLNQVVARAYGEENHYAGTFSQMEVDDLILDERIIELSVEGKSYHDIRRFGEAFTRIPSLVGREGDKSGNVLFFPVAQDVINRNPSISQTPGY